MFLDYEHTKPDSHGWHVDFVASMAIYIFSPILHLYKYYPVNVANSIFSELIGRCFGKAQITLENS